MNSNQDGLIQKTLLASFAYTIGMSYVQKAVVYSKDDPEKVEKYKEKFFQVCDDAMADLMMASVKPNERVLVLLQQINEERLHILRTLCDVRNMEPPRPAMVKALTQYANGMLQTCGQLISCYNNGQDPPVIKKATLKLPKVTSNTSVPIDTCIMKISDFKPAKESSKISYRLKVTHPLNNTVLIDDVFRSDQTYEVRLSGLQHSTPQKLSKLLRQKVPIELTRIKKQVIGNKAESIGSSQIPLNMFEKQHSYHANLQVRRCTFTVDAQVRDPFGQQSVENVPFVIHLSESAAESLQASATVPSSQPETVGGNRGRATANVPKPTAPTKTVQQTSHTTKAVPQPSKPAPKPQQPAKPKDGRELLKNALLLPQEELDQWIHIDVIIELLGFYEQQYKLVVHQNHLEMPEEFVRQHDILEAKKNKIEQDCENGTLTPEKFVQLLKKQIVRNTEAAKKKDPHDIVAGWLMYTVKKMKDTLSEMEE
ncbi:hypothetical protein TRFO_05002 [Tritrichomonas foetus]|uniref:Uncharacterized protein n=1 Tax=Tritrichomonas foetus TaxID=1144522 RepID=A0A1J4KDV5_9EUKA|nr:hypothetical protein TRFO_05002 [Tritrichomonas foetus]|eukprot:OHT07900.1 hypothetical protein TRFO_05002 [Tritrichomonas foetus]